MYPGVDIRNVDSTLFCVGLHFALECAKRPGSSPGGAWGWPERSLAIVVPICDVSGRVADLYEPIYISGIPWKRAGSRTFSD